MLLVDAMILLKLEIVLELCSALKTNSTLKTRDRMWHTSLVMGHACHVQSQAWNASATFAIQGFPIIEAGSESRVGYWMGHRQPQMGHGEF